MEGTGHPNPSYIRIKPDKNGVGTITARIEKKRDSLWFNRCKE
jgi:hypothetical protein